MTSTPRGDLPLATVLLLACCAGSGAAVSASPQGATQDRNAPRIPADTEVIEHQNGFRYSVLAAGSSASKPSLGDIATLHYTEWLGDGTLIRTTRGKMPVTVTVGDQQRSYALAIAPQLVGKGGRVKLTMPPGLAYGRKGVPGRIPADSTMIYEVELVDFKYRPKPVKFIAGDPGKTKATKSGLKYQMLTEGSGTHPDPNGIVDFEFTIWTLSGEEIFGSHKLGRTDRGAIQWMSHPFLHEILPMMRPGGECRVVVPQDLTAEQLTGETIWYLKLIDHEAAPALPAAQAADATSTRSGLSFVRLTEGSGERPGDKSICELEWAFWSKDGKFVSGSVIGGRMPVIVGQAQHAFLDEILPLMRVGEVVRVVVPKARTGPRELVFDTIWRLELVASREPLAVPGFRRPEADKLTRTASGIGYEVLAAGDGPRPASGTKVTYHYAMWLADGTLIDSSYQKGAPDTYTVDGSVRLMPGLAEALGMMRAGDRLLLQVPPGLGFGARGTSDGKVAPNSTLVLQVEVLSLGN